MFKPLIVGLIVTFLIAGSILGLQQTSTSLAATEVELWYFYDTIRETALNDLIAGFETIHPEIDIQASFHSYDTLPDEYQNAAEAGGGPALVLGRSEWGVPFFLAGNTVDVTSYINPALLDTVYPVALQAAKFYGALPGIPHTMGGVVPFRNPLILPDPPRTYAELALAAASATTEWVYGAYLERGPYIAAAHLYGMGGRLMDEFGCPVFNNPTGLAWVDLLESFADIGPADFNSDSDVSAYRSGNAGYITEGEWIWADIFDPSPFPTPDPQEFQMAIDPWPVPLSGFVYVENLYLNPNTGPETRSAAILFIEYLLSPEAQAQMLPWNLPTVQNVDFEDPILEQATAALASGVGYPALPQMNAYMHPLYLTLQSIFDQDADPAAALQQATNDILARLAEIGFGCDRHYLPAIRN